MMGRRGTDQLTIALFVVYLALTVLSRIFLFVSAGVGLTLNFLGVACAVYGIFRVLSRNIPARERENAWFMSWWSKVRRFFSRMTRRIRDRKTYVYVKCPGCKSELRVPRGKGKLIVTCPRCHREIRVTT